MSTEFVKYWDLSKDTRIFIRLSGQIISKSDFDFLRVCIDRTMEELRLRMLEVEREKAEAAR